jgi:hypothetical protein
MGLVRTALRYMGLVRTLLHGFSAYHITTPCIRNLLTFARSSDREGGESDEKMGIDLCLATRLSP